jgi:ATP/maltotriose-dependent transcriptional regulator MalT
VPLLQALQAHQELATAWRLAVMVHGIAGRYSRAGEAVQASIEHARHAGNERLVARNGLVLAVNALHGPLPVAQGIAQCERLLADGLADRQVACNVMGVLAQLHAMNGELAAARELYGRCRALLRDLGQGVYAASTGIDLVRVELLDGDLALAEREVAADQDFLAAKGETYFLSTMAALRARLQRDQGRDDEALAMSAVAEQATADDDTESQALWRMVRAPILARAGRLDAAEALAQQAVDLVRQTESPMLQAEALADQAEVLRLAGRTEASREAFNAALALCEAKGNRVRAQQLLDRMATLPT